MAIAARSTTPIEIIALDSMTLYRGFDIGTAKPTAAERAAVPHHMVDVLGPHDAFSVANYVAAAIQICEQIVDRGHVPLFVGGAGLYLRTMLRGFFDGPQSNPAIRERLEAEQKRVGNDAFHRQLAVVDPATAARFHPNDARRIVRAMEVYELTGRTLSEWQDEQPRPEPARAVWIDPPRDWIHDRINTRVDQMLAEGWLDEVRMLLATDPPPDSIFWTMLGYPQLAEVVSGDRDLADATKRVKELTRQFAKRQYTWFRNLTEVQAIPLDPSQSTGVLAEQFAAALDIPLR